MELACLLALFFVVLNMLDAESTTLALSVGTGEVNKVATSFGCDIVLKTQVSPLCVAPLLFGKWW